MSRQQYKAYQVFKFYITLYVFWAIIVSQKQLCDSHHS